MAQSRRRVYDLRHFRAGAKLAQIQRILCSWVTNSIVHGRKKSQYIYKKKLDAQKIFSNELLLPTTHVELIRRAPSLPAARRGVARTLTAVSAGWRWRGGPICRTTSNRSCTTRTKREIFPNNNDNTFFRNNSQKVWDFQRGHHHSAEERKRANRTGKQNV